MNRELCSLRWESIPQNVLDLLAYFFSEKSDMPTRGRVYALEFKLDNPWWNLTQGGDLLFHVESEVSPQFKHWDDPGWAIVFTWDTHGDPSRGVQGWNELLQATR